MKNKIGLFGAALLIGLSVPLRAFAAGEDSHLTLQDAVAKGVQTSPYYGAIANDSLAAREALTQAQALWLPSLDLQGETGYERTDSRSIQDETLWRSRASLTLTQLLFDGNGTNSEIRRQKSRVRSSAYRVSEAAEFVALDITDAYLEVLRQRDLLAIARANVEDHMRILETIREGAAAGTVTEGDVSQALARQAQARATVSSNEQALREAEAFFRQTVGEMPGNMTLPDIPQDKLPEEVEEAVRISLTQSPTLSVYEADIKAAEAELEATRSPFYPRVELQANSSNGDNIDGVEGDENRQSILAVMRWNLYRGGADMARQREYLYRHAGTKERRADAARELEKNVRDTWAGMLAAGERAEQFMEQATANEKVVAVYLDQFSLNRRTLLDVLDAQNELFVSRASHVNATYTEMFAVYRMLALEGKLLGTLGVAPPRETKIDIE